MNRRTPQDYLLTILAAEREIAATPCLYVRLAARGQRQLVRFDGAGNGAPASSGKRAWRAFAAQVHA
jgi:hypothetical protein